MLNVEKYKDEIIEKAKELEKDYGFPIFKAIADIINKDSPNFYEYVEWLFSEYEPPLLKNGDDLKPGDWIMVNNGLQDWYKKQFTYYYNDKFYCAQDEHDLEYGKSYSWPYARFPEEGE